MSTNKLTLYPTKWGKFYGYPEELIIGRTVSTDDKPWDGFVLDFAAKYIRPGSTAIDIGAHFGFHTVCMAKLAASVIAVEPICYLYLKKNIDVNGLQAKVLIVPQPAYFKNGVGLSIYDHDGKLISLRDIDFHKENNPGGFSMRETKWPEYTSVKIDDLIYKHEVVSFIKVDAQGQDLNALLGLRETIDRDKPAIVFEYEEGLAKLVGQTWFDYMSFLDDINYSAESVKGWENNFICLPR